MIRPHSLARLGCTCLVLAGQGSATVLLNEILADPSGSEAQDEFIELLNPGPAPVDLAGWTLDDGVGSDRIVDGGGGLVLPAGAIAIVLDSGYAGFWEERIPDEALRLSIDDASFGSNGLSNSQSERLYLRRPDGSLADSVLAPPNLGPDTSWERIRARALCPSCWQASPAGGASPGAENAGLPRDLDLTLLTLEPGRLVIQARGRLGFAGELHWQAGLDPCSHEARWPLDGDSAELWTLAPEPPPLFGWNPIRIASRSSSGERLLDTLLWHQPTGRQLIIDEVSTRAEDWVELYLSGDCPCLLDGLRLATRSRTHTLTGVLQAGQRLLLGPLTPDCPQALWLEAEPVLARDGWVRLEAQSGPVVETAQWPPEDGVWQRLGLDLPAEEGRSWAQRPGTPGCAAIHADREPGGGFRLSGRLLADHGPPEATLLRIDGPPGGFVLDVFSRSGKHRFRQQSTGEALFWDGRDEGGQRLPGGVWILHLQGRGHEELHTVVLTP
jgi:hypothetical protein